MRQTTATFIVNGVQRELVVDANALLSEVLPDDLGHHGVHMSCGRGDCGSCTVLIDGRPALACLTLAVTARGKEILTIEGLAKGNQLHALQKAFVADGAVQCGYCTPGMILAAKALLDRNPNPTRDDVKHGLAGNLCRCTGYNKIIEAVLDAAKGGD